MKVVKQKFSLPVINYDKITTNNTFKKHGKLFGGNSKRALLVGPSNCGKTNVMLSLIEHPNGLRFSNIFVYSKSLHQDKYNYLRTLMSPALQQEDEEEDGETIGYYEFNDADEVIQPSEIPPYSLIIFDDVSSYNQDVIRGFFSFGRHKNTDCFYLAQTYTAIPKHLLRDNANLLVIFQQDITNLRRIFEDHCSMDMSFSDFKTLCAMCWKNAKNGFLVIDKDCDLDEGRYRSGFDSFIHI